MAVPHVRPPKTAPPNRNLAERREIAPADGELSFEIGIEATLKSQRLGGVICVPADGFWLYSEVQEDSPGLDLHSKGSETARKSIEEGLKAKGC